MTNLHDAIAHEEAVRAAAMERANQILAAGGSVRVDFVRTPLRTVINLVERDASGACIGLSNVGELWLGYERRAAS